MIGLHFRILLGIDDSVKMIEASIAITKKASKDGIKIIVATPHPKNGLYENSKSKIIHEVENLNSRLALEGINIKILSG